MTKLDIKLVSESIIKLDFQKHDIEINPYISLESKYTLLNNYLQTVNNPEYDNIRKYIESEYALKLGIVELQTNIDIHKITIDAIINSGLYEKIVSSIKNFYELRDDIDAVVKRDNDSKSVSIAFVKMTDKVIEFLDKLSKVDLSTEGIQKLLAAFNVEAEKLKEYYPIVKTEITKPVTKHKSKKDLIQ
jgi:hypothetical protein